MRICSWVDIESELLFEFENTFDGPPLSGVVFTHILLEVLECHVSDHSDNYKKMCKKRNTRREARMQTCSRSVVVDRGGEERISSGQMLVEIVGKKVHLEVILLV